MNREGYGIFQSENGEWYIDTPEEIYGSYDTQNEAEEGLKKAYPEITKYAIIPYSEITEWTT